MRSVIFDFDGTIVDSLAAVIKVVETITKRKRPFSEGEIAELQHLDPLQIALKLGVKKWKIPWLLFKGRRMFRSHMRSVHVHEGITEVIAQLHAQNVQLYILSSNSKSNVQKYLQWHHLDGYFVNIYGNAGLLGKTRKLRTLFKNEHIESTGSWYIGDETRDIISSRAAGLRSIAVSWGYNSRAALANKKPDALVDTPSQILKVLQREGVLIQ